MDDRQGRHHPGAPGVGDHRRHRQDPSQLYTELTERFGDPVYQRVDAAASKEQKARLSKLDGDAITADNAGRRPDHGEALEGPGQRRGRRRRQGRHGQGLVRRPPSGTEDVYKIYAESFVGQSTSSRCSVRRRRSWTPPRRVVPDDRRGRHRIRPVTPSSFHDLLVLRVGPLLHMPRAPCRCPQERGGWEQSVCAGCIFAVRATTTLPRARVRATREHQYARETE